MCLLCNFACFCRLLIFIKINVLKNIFQGCHQRVNHLDQDFVGPAFGSNCLQILSADGTRNQNEIVDAISANGDMQVTENIRTCLSVVFDLW